MKGKSTISHSYGRCMGETGQSTEGCVINIHDKMANGKSQDDEFLSKPLHQKLKQW